MSSTASVQSPGPTRTSFDAGLPKTRLGKWSMGLAAAFVVGFAMNAVFVGVFGRSNDAVLNEFSRTYLPYWGVALFATGFFAGVMGLIAIWKAGERSLITLVSVVPMLFVIFFLLGEFLIPH